MKTYAERDDEKIKKAERFSAIAKKARADGHKKKAIKFAEKADAIFESFEDLN